MVQWAIGSPKNISPTTGVASDCDYDNWGVLNPEIGPAQGLEIDDSYVYKPYVLPGFPGLDAKLI